MIGLLFTLSLVSFFIIELPPGDYLTLRIQQLIVSGQEVNQATIESLKVQYGWGKPFIIRYGKWISGIIFKGDFGRSLQWNQSVSTLIMERLPYTVMISLLAIIVTYLTAIPIAIYSATHQYSPIDYAITIIGFVGLATPPFLLALVVIYFLYTTLGVPVGGLFSEQYAAAPWSFGKVVDLLRHLVAPVIILGMAGTAGNIRVLRATLLDELSMEYVDTARLKGLPETKLILKYPVRVAMNPMWSTIGYLLPAIVSGGTIVEVVFNLPTIGPLLLGSLKTQDMYLAGSIVFILTALTLVGTLLSDIILAISDPRIRYE